MKMKRISVSFCDEARLKIEALSEAKNISFAQATNEMVLRSSDAFQIEVRNQLEQSEATANKTAKLEGNMATIVDVLSSMNAGIEIIKNKIR